MSLLEKSYSHLFERNCYHVPFSENEFYPCGFRTKHKILPKEIPEFRRVSVFIQFFFFLMFLIVLVWYSLFCEKSSWLREIEDLLIHFQIFVQFQGSLCDPFSVTGLKEPNQELNNPVFLTILFVTLVTKTLVTVSCLKCVSSLRETQIPIKVFNCYVKSHIL